MSDQDLKIKHFMAQKLAEKESLSEIQKQVNETFGTRLTYMEIRILASELEDIDWKAFDPAPAKKEEEGTEEAAEAVPGGKSGTVVEVSKLVRPGTALSGSVVFRSGSKADWYVDSYGRLGIENLQGAEPTEDDVREFQTELQKKLGR